MSIDFDLPEALIARQPSDRRDQSRMLVVNRAAGEIQHRKFSDLPKLLNENYFLVLNEAKVDPVRVFWTDPKGKNQEIVFLKNIADENNFSTWEAIVSGKNLKVNVPYSIENGFEFFLLKDRSQSIATIQVNQNKAGVEKILEKKGQLPIPPYILSKRREDGLETYTDHDRENYQTVFSKKSGAVAAPTAGLHFTKETFEDLKQKNIDWDFLHLSVGWGTFSPLTEEHFKTKKLHPESCELSAQVAQKILDQKQMGNKILAVGTTATRTLETWANQGMDKSGFAGDTDLFIFPPYPFKVVDAMLTNFHIPQSSLLLLVASFLGKDGEKQILDIYHQAIEEKYRFYSYGDCMLIL